jgi:SAM-dependent methyltransferase
LSRATNDPDLVRAEYADESRFAVRVEAWQNVAGARPREEAFRAVAEVAPEDVLEVGCGRGELAARIASELGARVVALDVSERMVELARDAGVDATIGDVQELPFEDSSFDCAVAAWMLYHVPDVDRGLAELARVLRPGGRLVAVTNGERNLPELWGRFGERSRRLHAFSVENAEGQLKRHFARVTRRDANGIVTFPDWQAADRYVSASVTRRDLAGKLPRFEGPLECSLIVSVFVAEKSP